MTRPLAYDRKEIAIEKALNDSDDLMDLDTMIKDLKHAMQQAVHWHERNPTNERYHFDMSGLVMALEDMEAVRARVEEDVIEEAF